MRSSPGSPSRSRSLTCSGPAARHGWTGCGCRSPHAGKVTSLRQLAGELSAEIAMLSQVIGDLLAGDRGYQVIQQLPGIGPVLAAVIVAEIGDTPGSRTRRSCARGPG